MYDLDYYENMLRIYSESAGYICGVRWEFISELAPKVVLDYGCGVGWFRAYRPEGVEVYTYDIGPAPQTGLELRMYDVTCFWDVLEHITDFSVIEPVLALSRHVAVTVPIFEDDPAALSNWKHFKPGEHLHYFTPETLGALMARYGFVEKKRGQPECPPREDVWSFMFKKQ